MNIQLKRAYEDVAEKDGKRVLVDKIWPRGKSKKELKIDEWLKEIAPTTDLRKWFDHDEEKFAEFKQRYKKELKSGKQKEAFEQLQEISQKGKITLIYGAKDTKHNQAVVLKELLEKK